MVRPHRPHGANRWRSARGTTAAQYAVLILLVAVVIVVAAVLLFGRLQDDTGLSLLGGAI